MANQTVIHSTMSGPIPGQSLTHEPKSQAWEKPPQHTKLDDAMNMLMTQLTEPEHLKALLNMMESGMPLESICRTILFTGFSLGKWTPDLAMLMYKPLMVTLIAIAHRAKIKDVPIVMKEGMDNHLMGKVKNYAMGQALKGNVIPTAPIPGEEDRSPLTQSTKGGFFTTPFTGVK